MVSTMSAAAVAIPEKILLVEDDQDLLRGLGRRLRSWGYDVVFASDGMTAVSVARTEHPDLVLLDLGLPAGDGFVVLERYAKLPALCTIPVIVLTGRDRRTCELTARRLGVAGFLTKPNDNDVLLD
ncbi:MAG: hypothetical protein QOD72_755, partial [Acidimicrobiaceae bacterium]|nr:hypothetical protein [Acidimicrobiaceae bacterium]